MWIQSILFFKMLTFNIYQHNLYDIFPQGGRLRRKICLTISFLIIKFPGERCKKLNFQIAIEI